MQIINIDKAVELLNQGRIIAFPTETVYGIGTKIDNTEAIKKIFKIKGRSFNKPLQILFSNYNEANQLAIEISAEINEFISKNMPGPITLILEKSSLVSDLITANAKTVGIRMPKHKLMLDLLNKVGPIVATSANKSEQNPALSVEEVTKALPEINYILDGEKPTHGISSTVIDATQIPFKILRQGSFKLT